MNSTNHKCELEYETRIQCVESTHTEQEIDREMEWVKSIHENTYFDGINMPNRPLNSISLADKRSVEEVNWANVIAHLLYFLDDEEVPYFHSTKKKISCEILNYRPSHSFTIEICHKISFCSFFKWKVFVIKASNILCCITWERNVITVPSSAIVWHLAWK